jgi:hypothetical protein
VKEVWKASQIDIVQDRYAISTHGRIFDLQNQKYLSWSDNGAGYKIVGLQRKDKSNVAIRYVHRLVAIAFPDNLPQVGHRDHTRANNSVDNLYWTTQKQNTRDGIDAGRINANRPKANRKVTKEIICKIALLESLGYGVNEIAMKIDFPRTTISSVFNGRSNNELFEFVRKEIKDSSCTP